MKNLYTILIVVLISASVFAQAPQKMSYQAVVRNSSDQLVTNSNIGVQVSIVQSSTTGTDLYVERHFPTTNNNGLLTLEIGTGTVISGSFNTIDWANDIYFIKTEIDLNGGANYTISSTSQLLSVPYALHAQTADSIVGGVTENDPVFSTWDKSYNDLTNTPNITDTVTSVLDTTTQFVRNETQNLSQVLSESNDGGSLQIKNIADPTEEQDAVTKAYVDLLKAQIEDLEEQVYGVTDYDGNFYKGVKIGTQIWMAENLKVTHYPNGDSIPFVTDNTVWSNLGDDNTSDAYCYYDNNSANANYGALYTYAASIGDNWARDNNSNQGICPDNWHLPTDTEWKILEMYLGMSQTEADNIDWRGTDEGGKLKEIGLTHWNSPNTGATNESNFSALPSGYHGNYVGLFYDLGNVTNWWSATESDSYNSFGRYLGYDNAKAFRHDFGKSFGFSVRCIKD